MKTYGLKLKRRSAFPPRVQAIADVVEDPPVLPSITDFIEQLIEESPELLHHAPDREEDNKIKTQTSTSISSPSHESGMIFIPQPSQVRKYKKTSPIQFKFIVNKECMMYYT